MCGWQYNQLPRILLEIPVAPKNMLRPVNRRWLLLSDDFFHDLDDCAAYFAVVNTFMDHIWWSREGSFGIPLHRKSLEAAAKWAEEDEQRYRESLNTTSHRLERHQQFEACVSGLMGCAEKIVRQRFDIDGTDFSDLDVFDEVRFPELPPLAFQSLNDLLELALTLNKG